MSLACVAANGERIRRPIEELAVYDDPDKPDRRNSADAADAVETLIHTAPLFDRSWDYEIKGEDCRWNA